MYQRQVSSSARPVVEATISSVDAVPPPSRDRLWTYGVTALPVVLADARVCTSAASAPSRIQSVGPSGSPLSKTLVIDDDAVATTKGVVASSGSVGSLDSRSPAGPRCSPTRVPPPAREKTVRPSAALRPDD